MEPLAHSARRFGEIQLYKDHVEGATALFRRFLAEMKPFIAEDIYEELNKCVLGAEIHDMGKLDSQNQLALMDDNWKGRLPVPHKTAGAWYLYKYCHDVFLAAVIAGHHRPGIPDINGELGSSAPFCDGRGEIPGSRENMRDYTDSHMAEYLECHKSSLGDDSPAEHDPVSICSALEERIILSCLVDADWSDTGRKTQKIILPRWEERLAKLDMYIADIEKKAAQKDSKDEAERNMLRHSVYSYCRNNADINVFLQNGEAAVGTGKTTAVMAHLLRGAAQRQLRHIFVILPYTSILHQVEKILKEALVLSGECGEEIIAVQHHNADYSSPAMRELAVSWEAPIILTTAVNLFESMAGNTPARLRKLHQLPGSAFFLDEFHACVPAACLPVVWQWLTELSNKWGCSIVVATGTMVRFWEKSNFRRVYGGKHPEKYPIQRPGQLLPADIQDRLVKQEKIRVQLHITPGEFKRCKFRTLEELADFALSKAGPRVIVVDTRETAAIVAQELKQRRQKVYHLSNAFTPQDSAEILKRVEKELEEADADSGRGDWTLVSTTYACMGLNLSFRNGFCQAFSCTVFLQLIGRISRNGEYPDAGLWAFALKDAKVTENRQMAVQRDIWTEMIANGVEGKPLAELPPSELATYSFNEECKMSFGVSKVQTGFLSAERSYQFAGMAQTFKIISEEPEILAITDSRLISELGMKGKWLRTELQKKSVSIYKSLADRLHLEEITGFPGLYYLPPDQYDPELLGCFKTLV